MRQYYAGWFFLFFALFAVPASAQLHWEINTDNAVLRHAALEEQKVLNIPEEALSPAGIIRNNDNCPLEFLGTYYVFKGDTLIIAVDTIALGGGPNATLKLVDCGPVQYGSASLEGNQLIYISDPGIDGAADTLCVDFCKDGTDCQTFVYPIVVKRPGQVHNPAPVVLQAEEFLEEYCLDESVLPGNLYCNYFDNCPDTYDGEGQQTFYFTQYSQAASCFRYKAGRFAGADRVCVILCDDFTVCDTFQVTFLIQNDTLSLPFFDDFSYDGPYPSGAYWLDRAAYVNNTQAPNAPSVGMATFDGIDRAGRPYPNIGSADALTSKYIDLGNPGGSVYLKFFTCPKGYGLYPNEPDSLIVEFRRPDGQWMQVATYSGLLDDIPIDSVPPFEFRSIQVEDDFHYDGFQFRFRNYISPGGLYDLWHLDYVYLNDQEGPGNTFDDIAFSRQPPSFLRRYSSMPWWHFENFVEEELYIGPLASGFYNHFSETVTIADSDILVYETITGNTLPGSDNVVDGPDANIPPKQPVNRQKTLSSITLANYISALQTGFPGAELVDLVMEYQLTVNSQQALFFRNDTVRYHNRFDNYFAYDDGTAERFIFFENPQSVNPTLAVKFHANVADSLRGVQFHFPHVNGDAENQLFNLRVWVGSLDSEPAYEFIFKTPLYADSKFDTIQGITTYRLVNVLKELTPVGLPAGTDFYIGFQQVTITNQGIPIGFDVNNDASEHLFFDLGTGWKPFPDNLRGAPMIRAIVGSETPIDTDVEELVERVPQIRLAPNPTTGLLMLSGVEDLEGKAIYTLVDAMGQAVQQGLVHTRLDLSRHPNGLYVLLIRMSGGATWSEKVVLAR